MAKLLKLRRGTDTQHTTFTGAEGEVTVNTTNDSLHVHDGTTAGGTELAKADLSNVDGSLSNNLGFADGTKALFGTGNDLEIYHNGSDSVISDLGTGDLYIKSSSTFIRTGTNESMANFNADGSVQLYHDNSQKLATTSTGINVTGTVTCDGLTSDGEVLSHLQFRLTACRKAATTASELDLVTPAALVTTARPISQLLHTLTGVAVRVELTKVVILKYMVLDEATFSMDQLGFILTTMVKLMFG